MGVIWTPREWQSQPPGFAEPNRLAPGGLITTLLPLGGSNLDAISSAKLTYGSGRSVGADSRGISLKGSGSAAVASIPINLSDYNKITISFWGYWDTFANDDKFFAEYTANANSNAGFFINPNRSADSTFSLQCCDSALNVKTATFSRPTGAAWHHYFVTYDLTTGAGSTGITAYVDGILKTLTYTSTTGQTGNFANDTLYLFSRNNASLFGAGRMQNFVIRGGYVGSAVDALNEYRNAWQLFAPEYDIAVTSAGAADFIAQKLRVISQSISASNF